MPSAEHWRSCIVPLAGIEIPPLDGSELRVFKMMYARPRDWIDIEEVLRAGTIDVAEACTAFGRTMGPEHEASVRLRTIASTVVLRSPTAEQSSQSSRS